MPATHPTIATSIPRHLPAGRYPLSFAQQRLWIIEQLAPGSAVYTSQRALRLDGALDVDALRRALADIVRRHDILRTTFPLVGDTAMQIVHAPDTQALKAIEQDALDLSHLSAADRDDALERATVSFAGPFDVERGPLLRLRLVRLANDAHVLLIGLHHMAADGWSFAIFGRELERLYAAHVAGAAAALPPLSIQYGDYAAWQRASLDEEALRALIAYWTRQLAGGLPQLRLGTDTRSRAGDAHGGAIESIELTAHETAALAAVARRTRTTMFMVIVAGLAVVLHDWTGETTIPIGTDIGGRQHADTSGLIGLFVNQVLLRLDLAGVRDVASLLAHARAVTLGAFAHQDLPFDRLVRTLPSLREGRVEALSPVHIVYQRAPRPAGHIDGLTFTTMRPRHTPARFDLTLFVRDRRTADGADGEGLTLSCVYRPERVDAAMVRMRLTQLRAALATIGARPEAAWTELRRAMAEVERSHRNMDATERTAASVQRFRRITPTPIALQQDPVRSGPLPGGGRLPLVVQPNGAAPIDLAAWLTERREWLESQLLVHGAVLCRGFGIDSAKAFERVGQSVCPNLFEDNGEHVRDHVAGKVYTPTFYPSDKKVLWHNENSFNREWPRLIMFCCLTPAAEGGETPLADSRQVCDAIDPAIRDAFARKQIRYIRNYGSGMGLPWQTVFRTTSRADVEQHCAQHDIQFEWKTGDRLRTMSVRPAIIKHPRTGESTWFNQAQHWHLSCLDPEVRETLLATLSEDDLPRTCTYGDGSAIPDAVMDAICAVYRAHEVSYPWQQGDVVIIDNVLTAHARNPYKGERKLCVALGEMTSYADVSGA